MMFISSGANNLISSMNIGNRPDGTHYVPLVCGKKIKEGMRIGDEALREWFLRCVSSGSYSDFCIEDNIAVLGIKKWDKSGLKYLNLQALVTLRGTIADMCRSGENNNEWNDKCHYYRLEYDPSKPGPIFKEPLPHVHVYPGGAPRFQFSGCDPKTLFVDFIEFLYLNYAHSKWVGWARRIWKQGTDFSPCEDSFDAVVAAYDGGRSSELMGRYKGSVIDLKMVLKKEKHRLSAGHAMLSDTADTLSYR